MTEREADNHKGCDVNGGGVRGAVEMVIGELETVQGAKVGAGSSRPD